MEDYDLLGILPRSVRIAEALGIPNLLKTCEQLAMLATVKTLGLHWSLIKSPNKSFKLVHTSAV